jgi:hypothetical protein
MALEVLAGIFLYAHGISMETLKFAIQPIYLNLHRTNLTIYICYVLFKEILEVSVKRGFHLFGVFLLREVFYLLLSTR